MIRTVSMLATAGVLAACAGTSPPPQMVASLDADPVLSGGSYDSGGGITVAVDIRENQGMTMVCGVWAQSKQQSILTKGKAKAVLDTGAVVIGGETVLRGLRFMKEVPPMAGYAGQEAHCVVTSRPWQTGDTEIRIPRQVVHVEDDDDGGAFAVRFTQTGPGAGGA